MSQEKKLTVEQCRSYIINDQDFTDEEIIKLRDSMYRFAEFGLLLADQELTKSKSNLKGSQ